MRLDCLAIDCQRGGCAANIRTNCGSGRALQLLQRGDADVALTHDPKIDDPALTVALRSEAFYIGALGSRRTHAKRLERLSALGFGENQLSRIHAPIGLNIGAVSQAEIAVSIIGQMTTVLRQGDIQVSNVA